MSLHGLRQSPLFAELPQERLAEIAARCVWKQYAAGEVVRSAPPELARFHVVISGCVRIASYGANGRAVSFVDWTAGSYFGEIDIFDSEYAARRQVYAQAIEPSLVASMDRQMFIDLMYREPTVACAVTARLSRIVRVLAGRLMDLSTLNVRTRLHVRLLQLVFERAGVAAQTARLDPAPMHQDLADHVGTTREEVTREISRLVGEGLLRKEGRAWVFPDLATLRERVDSIRPLMPPPER